MRDGDPLGTQRYGSPDVVAELQGAGFDAAHEIGRGGFGVVYRCTQSALDRTVAVKVLTVDLDEENRARFFREQRAMGRLTGHPNIVNILQVGETGTGLPYIVMQYYPQDSLDQRLRRGGPLSLPEALRLGIRVAGAVETAHRLGVLHRDIKPANILLDDYGEPVLTDFGIAHVAGGFETATGTVTGTPAYTAPEVLAGDPPTPATDIYGIGATVFSAVTGHAAFERQSGEQVVAQFLRITTEPVPDLREQGIPDDVAESVARAMARAPGQRHATAASFGEDLQRLQHHHGFTVDDMALHAGSEEQHRGPPPAIGGRRSHDRRPRTAGNLPLELTSFVGRRRELTEAKKMLTSSPLVTLTGPGGVGKTRLALRIAASMQREFEHGVWLVEFGELHDESLLIDTVAGALGLCYISARPLGEVLEEFLETRNLLLVFDNCEQVVGGVAELSATLMQVCPSLKILSTSRESLGIPGEAVLRVAPLTVPSTDRQPALKGLPRYDAVTLFAERAATAVPDFELTEDNKDAVAKICHRLDGLPLAIELAAARLRALSPEQILQRLSDRYALLTRGTRGAPTRQQTLRLCFDWSFDLCEEQEQHLWTRLSVFAGSFGLDAAAHVGGPGIPPDELLDAVTSLVEKSILLREESGAEVRFRMLETVREYGREILALIDDDTAHRRHLEWYESLVLEAASNWMSARQLDWIERTGLELPNIRETLKFCVSNDPAAGLRIAGALFGLWSSQGYYSEGRSWLDRLLAAYAGPPTVELVKALFGGAFFDAAQTGSQTSEMTVQRGHTLAASINDPGLHAFIAHVDGLLALLRGDLTQACAYLEKAVAEPDARREPIYRVGPLGMLGMAHELREDMVRAIECHEQVLELTEQYGETLCRSFSLWGMGLAVWQEGNPSRGRELLEQSLQLTWPARFVRIAISCLESIAWISAEVRDTQRAAVLLGAAEELGRSVGGAVQFPDLMTYHDECERIARSALGQRAFESAHRQGRLMDFDAAAAFALGEQAPSGAEPVSPTVRLTKRERQVADLVAEGMTNRAIAAKLVLSDRTVQGHVEHILAKLGFTSRAQVAAWVVEQAHSAPDSGRRP
ncbi:protein kinase domain-containing protein [Rhodococcus sp. LB1]|uniref:protein kinase domain-containing protein n=1 Tax=Rhodococcus sp. LB1 TaxID=1807499 RepID=UPI00077A250B|nr:protein kinase [Rhodococcus sp. LB1]KXX62405.1 protein kinase [Rhodococcus sp. LB1]